MKLSHDSAGFLTGDVIHDIKRSNNVLNTIKNDVAAIKRAVIGMNQVEKISPAKTVNPVAQSTRQSSTRQANVKQGAVVVPLARKSIVRAIDKSTGPTDQQNAAVKNGTVAVPHVQKAAEPKAVRKHDAAGRFVANAQAAQASIAEPKSGRDNRGRFAANGDSDEQKQRNLINGLGNKIAEAVTGLDTGMEEVDPIVKAFNEVAQPLARGYQMFFGGDRDKGNIRWYRRILGEIKLFRKEDTAYNKAAKKSLKAIEDKPTVIDDDGGKSFFGGLLGSILPWLLGAITGLGPMLLTGIRTLFGGLGPILRIAFAGVFSPVGLTIAGLATAAWGVFTEDGRKFFSDIGTRISDKWDSAVAWFKETFPGITKKFAEVADSIAALWKPIADFFKDKFGIVSNTVSKGVESIKSAVNDNVLAPASGLISQGVESVKAVPKKLMDRWNDAKQYLGAAAVKAGIDPGIVARITGFESGFNSEARPTRKDGSRISSAHGYGQFLDATWTDMLNKYGAKYGVQNAGNLTKEEANKLRSNKDLQAAMLAEFTKENLEKGRALGGTNDDANIYALHNLGSRTGANFLKALKNNPNAPVNSIKGLTDSVIKGNKSLYGNGKITVAEAYANMTAAMSRGDIFAKDIRSLLPAAAIAPAQSVFVPSPRLPKAPAPVAIQESPGVTVPMGGSRDDKPIFVSLPIGEISQDVSCRKIALIATGGLSSG